MADPITNAAAQTGVGLLVTDVIKIWKHVKSFRDNIRDLNRVLNDLKTKTEGVQREVDEADRKAENIQQEVKDWLDQATKIIEDATAVVKKEDKGCFCRVIPNPCTRYDTAKEAEDLKKAIDELTRKSNEFRRISYVSAPPGIVTGQYTAGSNWIITRSRASVLKDINKALLDPNTRIVGIWGASGTGKSTLLREVEKQVHEKQFNYDFDEVTVAVVSRSRNPAMIQDDLAWRLGLKLNEEKSVDQKAHRLRERLSQKKKVLIVLDDIWRKIDLQELGIPLDDDHPGVKLLLTSRFKEVLISEMNSEQNFHLDRLEDSEAKDLFKHIIGDRPQEASLIGQLAKECAGLPVLIFPLAATLKSRHPSEWDEAISELRRFNNLNMEEFIQKSLAFNYHRIEDEEVKSLFLLCGRMRNQIISVNDLLIFGMGLGLQKGARTMDEARGNLKSLLNNLIDSCLLENYRENFIKLHDRIGDATLSIASETYPSLVIKTIKSLTAYSDNDLRGFKSITLCLDDKMHEILGRLTCPILEMLLIYNEAPQSTRLEIPDAFFKDLRELKVLNLSDWIIPSLPSSIQFLNKLQTLCLDRVVIEDIVMIGMLKALRSLTFRGSNISRIPKEIGDLSNLRLLDLSHCHDLAVIEPDVLRRLEYLEELNLPLDFIGWDEEGISNASPTELNNMSYLSNLTICVPNAVSFPSNMVTEGLVRYYIQIGHAWAWKLQVEARTLRIELDSHNSKLIYKEWLQVILKKTQQLDLHGWVGFEETFSKFSKEGFLQLKRIHIESCPSIKYIIDSDKPDPFPILESLSLFGLIKLQKICMDSLPCLGKLKVIKIQACDELESLFSFSSVKYLSLVEIEVSDCTGMKEIINSVNEGEKVELTRLRKLKLVNLPTISSFSYNANQTNGENIGDDGNNLFWFLDGRQVSLPCLKSMILCELPKLRRISNGQHRVNLHNLKSLELLKCSNLSYALDSNLLQELKNLESLKIEDCGSMATVFQLNTCDATLDQSLQVVSSILQRIKKLDVSKCDRLENLCSTSIARSLGSISEISIASCRMMNEIFLEENHGQEIEFSSLSSLTISDMENLTMFCKGNHHHRFPGLMQLVISQCPKMRTFVPCNDATGRESFFNEKVDLPRLEKLVLHSLASLISIWGNELSEPSFRELASIEIVECKDVESIFHSHLMERLQNLTKVRLVDLEKLRHVVEKAWTFPSLKDIHVEKCDNLTYLFPHDIVKTKSLSNLANMHISSCIRLLEVIAFNGEDSDMLLTKAMIFYNLSSLHLENLDGLVHFSSAHYELHFPSLNELSIIGCMSMEAFVPWSSNLDKSEEQLSKASTSNIEVEISPLFNEKVVFSNLKDLQIKGLKVKEIWPKKEPGCFFMELKKLEVEDCHQLSTIVPSFMLSNLHNLEHLSVKSCNSVEVTIELDEKHYTRRQKILEHLCKLIVSSCESIRHIVATREGDCIRRTYYKTVVLPQLSSLVLSGLPKLSSFCRKHHEIELSAIEELEIKDCQNVHALIADSDQDCEPLLLVKKIEFPRLVSMVIINMEKLAKLWHIREEGTNSECSSEAFCKLKRLKVEECGSLLTIFPTKMIQAFHNLEELIVELCQSLESVFESTESRSRTESSHFNHVVSLTTFALRKLWLLHLPQMKHVWNVEDPRWVDRSFEKLREIYINDCYNLIHLFPASFAGFLPQLYCLVIDDCKGMEDIVWNANSAHQQSLSTQPESSNLSLDVHSLKWPSLEKLTITRCPNAKILASVLRENKDVTDIDDLLKVNIPRLTTVSTDASTLENRQFLDEIHANPTCLALREIENQAWVKSIPWSFLLERFPNIGTFMIRESDSKEIFPSEKENVGAAEILDVVKHLYIRECHRLTIFPPFLALFRNLTSLTVRRCNGLRYLVTSSVSRGLMQLTRLVIRECNNLEEIITYDCDEDGNKAKHDDDMISFPHLTTLRLIDLPILRSFSSTSCKFSFPSFKDIYMEKLPKMDVFCEGELITPYKHRITRNVRALYNGEVEWWSIRPGS